MINNISIRIIKARDFLKSKSSITRIISAFEMGDFVEFECEKCGDLITYRVYDNEDEMRVVIH